jgi:perosamine synthetase
MIPHSRPSLGVEEEEAVTRVIRSGHLAQGEEVEALERELAARLGVAYVVAVSSGSAALHLSLISLEVTEEQSVILPSYVCSALLNAIRHVGASPIPVDIDPDTLNISPQIVASQLSKNTGAILVPHMFGRCADLSSLLTLGIPLVEDCAMSLGAYYNGEAAGSLGKVGVFSFYATKVLCGGEGGAVATNDPAIRERVSDLRDYDGRNDALPRFNYKLTDLQAAVIRTQLTKLDDFIERRRSLGSLYTETLTDTDAILPTFQEGDFPFRYVIHHQDGAERLAAKFSDEGISARNPVHSPIHTCLSLSDSAYPNTVTAQGSALSLPLYPALSDDEVDQITTTAREIL